jgi:hypothetical protein
MKGVVLVSCLCGVGKEFRNSRYFIVLGLMSAFVLMFALSPRGGDLPLVVIGMVMITAAFMSVRNIALAVIAICTPLARHSGILAARWRAGRPLVSSSAELPQARYHRVEREPNCVQYLQY